MDCGGLRLDCGWIAVDCGGLRLDCGWIAVDCGGLRWIAVDCGGLRWIAVISLTALSHMYFRVDGSIFVVYVHINLQWGLHILGWCAMKISHG